MNELEYIYMLLEVIGKQLLESRFRLICFEERLQC